MSVWKGTPTGTVATTRFRSAYEAVVVYTAICEGGIQTTVFGVLAPHVPASTVNSANFFVSDATSNVPLTASLLWLRMRARTSSGPQT